MMWGCSFENIEMMMGYRGFVVGSMRKCFQYMTYDLYRRYVINYIKAMPNVIHGWKLILLQGKYNKGDVNSGSWPGGL